MTQLIEEPKKRFQLPSVQWLSVLASPWILITIPVLIGGFWLVLHPALITGNLDKPYALLAGPALVGSILLVWFLVVFFRTIVSGCRKIWKAFRDWSAKPGSTFWIIINIFLLVSVSESGNYFNGLLGSNDMYGVLGYAVAFVVDLVAIQCMQARLGASRMRDVQGERLYQLGVIACAGLSAWTNTYTALEHFQAPVGATHLPTIMITIAPWTGMAFPLLIIFLSFTADYTADQTTSKLDPDAYKIAEGKRNQLIAYQRDALRERKGIELDIDQMNGKVTKIKVEREFVLLRIFFPAKHPNMEQMIEQIKSDMNAIYEPQLQAQMLQFQQMLTTQSEETQAGFQRIYTSVSSLGNAVSTLTNNVTQMQENVTFLEEEFTTFLPSQNEQKTDELEQLPSQETDPEIPIASSSERGSNATLGEGANERKEEGKPRPKTGYIIEDDPDAIALVNDYPILQRWLSTGAKSASIEEIIEMTNLSRKMINNRITDGTLKRTKKPNTYTAESIIKWLKAYQANAAKRSTISLVKTRTTGKLNDVLVGEENGEKSPDNQEENAQEMAS